MPTVPRAMEAPALGGTPNRKAAAWPLTQIIPAPILAIWMKSAFRSTI